MVSILRGSPHAARGDTTKVAGDRLIEALDEVALPPLTDPAHEPGPLQLLHVVVDVLAGLADLAGRGGGRRRLAQCLQHLHPDRMGQRLERLGVLDQLDLAVQPRLPTGTMVF